MDEEAGRGGQGGTGNKNKANSLILFPPRRLLSLLRVLAFPVTTAKIIVLNLVSIIFKPQTLVSAQITI